MPIYIFRNPKTDEIFEELVSFAEADNPVILEDGTECYRIPFFENPPFMVNKNAEVWSKDSAYVKKLKPKYVKTRSGHRIRYDPTKHC